MKQIGILSDTHAYLQEKIPGEYFLHCDEIWHAGDIGTIDIIDKLHQTKIKNRIVWGNIDDQLIRRTVPEWQVFEIEEHKILLIHIAGKFESYTPQVRSLIKEHNPSILVCGHSHILKIAFDKKYNLLYLNPGACGLHGFQKVRTIVRFKMNGKEIKDLEVIELGSKK